MSIVNSKIIHFLHTVLTEETLFFNILRFVAVEPLLFRFRKGLHKKQLF